MNREPPRVVSLESVPPVPASDAPTKVKIARLITKERCGSNLLLGVAWLEPGDQTNVWSASAEDTTSPDEHWYGWIEETYFVLQGRLRLSWDEGVLEFGPNDAVYLAPEWRYHLENIGDDPAVLVYGITPSPE